MLQARRRFAPSLPPGPLLDVGDLVVLLAVAVLPRGVAAELAAIVLIFTSQAWNMTFSFYQAQQTLPSDLDEASRTFRFSPWLRFRTLELPFAAQG